MCSNLIGIYGNLKLNDVFIKRKNYSGLFIALVF